MLEHQKFLTVLKLARSFDKKIDFGVRSYRIRFSIFVGKVRISIKCKGDQRKLANFRNSYLLRCHPRICCLLRCHPRISHDFGGQTMNSSLAKACQLASAALSGEAGWRARELLSHWEEFASRAPGLTCGALLNDISPFFLDRGRFRSQWLVLGSRCLKCSFGCAKLRSVRNSKRYSISDFEFIHPT